MKTAGQNALDAFKHDHPEVFWVSTWSYWPDGFQMDSRSAPKRTVYCKQVGFRPVEIGNLAAEEERKAFETNVKAALRTIRSEPGAKSSKYLLARAVHDYLCEQLTYYEPEDETMRLFVRCAGSAFVYDDYHPAVCEGYAKAFKVLCDRLEIPCVLVTGYARAGSSGGDHMWNYVQMSNKKWYLVDVTWDDQERAGAADDTYYLAGSGTKGAYGTTLAKERTPDGDFNGAGYMSFSYPVLQQDRYVYRCQDGHIEVKDPAVLAMDMPMLLRNVGYSKEAGIGVALGGILNILLDPLFMFVLLP